MTQNSDDPATNVFAPAYIHVVYDIGDTNDNTVFAPNISANSGSAIRDLFDFDQVATDESATFWTGYLLGAYQYTIDRDNDPETETNWDVGITDDLNGQGSMVFFEPSGLKDCNSTPNFCSIPGTTAHEIGHLLNAGDGDGGIMGPTFDTLIFTPTSIVKMRAISHS